MSSYIQKPAQKFSLILASFAMSIFATAQSPALASGLLTNTIDHHCSIPDEMVGDWVMETLVMLRNGALGPRMSEVSGSSLIIACDGSYIEDATGATITAGPDMPAIPTGHTAQECTFSAGGSSGQIVSEDNGYRFTPESAGDVVADEVNCGGIMGRFGLHLHMGQNPWTLEMSSDNSQMTLTQTMQSSDAGEIAFMMVFDRQ